MENNSTGSIESRKDFTDTPSGQYIYWKKELDSSQKRLKTWRKQGAKVVKRFQGGADSLVPSTDDDRRSGPFRLNLFHSNTITLQSLLYGKLPTVDVSRRHADPKDDVGRVAAEIMGRILTNDIENNGEEYDSILKAVLQDRLLPGLGCARVRYEFEEGNEEAYAHDDPAPPDPSATIEDYGSLKEDAPTDYYHWRDVLWGWGRTFSSLPWIAFRSNLKKDEIAKRFGEEAADQVEYTHQAINDEKGETSSDPQLDGPWLVAEVWEIWDKTKREVVWVCPGYDKVLGTKPDFLKLSGFFPCPPFLLANQTTTIYQPVSDFYIAQDLYNEIDILETRISIITEAVKVVGLYDAANEDIARMFKEGTDNDLIPVQNWAIFAEKGGMDGAISWFPIKEVVQSLTELMRLRDDNIQLLQQITGMADIMRGQVNPYEGVGQSEMKADFGSVRVRALQEEFARFASDLLQLKAEVICKHFDPATISTLSNASELNEYKPELIGEAIMLIKDPDNFRVKVVVKSESMAMVDYQRLKAERTEYITALATFMQSASPLMEQDPGTTPYLLELLQWGLAGFQGADSIEGVLDQAIDASKKAQEQQKDKPDPEQQRMEQAMQAEQQKFQNDMQMEQAKHQNNMAEIQAKAEADEMRNAADVQGDIAKMRADLEADVAQIRAKMEADIMTEFQTSAINAQQAQQQTLGEMQKEIQKVSLEIQKMAASAAIELGKEEQMPKEEESDDA